MVHRSFGPLLSLSLSTAANANNWYNGPVSVTWVATDVIAGLKQVDWTGSGGVSGSSTTLDSSSFQVSVEGSALSGSVTATSVSAATSTGTVSFRIDKTAPVVTVPVLVGPAGIVPNALGYFDLTGRTDGVAVNVTAADATPGSGVQGVCYDLTGGTTCTPAAAGSGAGAFTLTVLSSVTNARIWSLDNAGNSSIAQLFTVKITRNAPQATGLSFSTPVNTNHAGTVTSTGGSGGGVAYAVVTAPAHGTLTLNANGAFTYAPATNYTGPDSFVFRVTDAVTGANTTATVTITVGNGTLPPVAASKAFTTNEDTALTIPGSSIVTDADTPAAGITLAIVTAPAHGTATASGATILYTPAADYNGADSFTYKASDPDGNVSNTATISMTVTAVNDTPSFTPGPSQTVNEDAAAVSGGQLGDRTSARARPTSRRRW